MGFTIRRGKRGTTISAAGADANALFEALTEPQRQAADTAHHQAKVSGALERDEQHRALCAQVQRGSSFGGGL